MKKNEKSSTTDRVPQWIGLPDGAYKPLLELNCIFESFEVKNTVHKLGDERFEFGDQRQDVLKMIVEKVKLMRIVLSNGKSVD
jgi:hypothetical protein